MWPRVLSALFASDKWWESSIGSGISRGRVRRKVFWPLNAHTHIGGLEVKGEKEKSSFDHLHRRLENLPPLPSFDMRAIDRTCENPLRPFIRRRLKLWRLHWWFTHLFKLPPWKWRPLSAHPLGCTSRHRLPELHNEEAKRRERALPLKGKGRKGKKMRCLQARLLSLEGPVTDGMKRITLASWEDNHISRYICCKYEKPFSSWIL